MRAFLIFLSSLVAFWCSGEEGVGRMSPLARYTFALETDRAGVTGVFLASEDSAGVYGAMVNEFGVSALDFEYSRKKDKVTLSRVVPFLDKWYIRRVLRDDIRYCLHVLYGIPYGRRSIYQTSIDTVTGKVTVYNPRRGLRYTFTPMQPTDNDSQE